MDVLAIGERFLERVDLGHMRSKSQFDLAVVGGEQDIAAFRHKGFANGATDFGADRDVLQVWVGRGKPTGLSSDEAVAGMDPACLRIDLRLQSVGVGRFEF